MLLTAVPDKVYIGHVILESRHGDYYACIEVLRPGFRMLDFQASHEVLHGTHSFQNASRTE